MGKYIYASDTISNNTGGNYETKYLCPSMSYFNSLHIWGVIILFKTVFDMLRNHNIVETVLSIIEDIFQFWFSLLLKSSGLLFQ